nr:hypothetical protein [Micromonospora sp. DSM 115978]
LGLLDRASALVPTGDHFTRAWLATWRADQLATLGDLATARTGVDTAATALGHADPGPPGFFSRRTFGYGTREHLDSVRGLVLALGDDAEAAERTFGGVQAAAANMRRVVATYGHTALARSRLRDPEGTCEALTKSVTTALREHYPMGIRRALGVRAGFDPAWATLPCVRDLDELLDAAAHGPSLDAGR